MSKAEAGIGVIGYIVMMVIVGFVMAAFIIMVNPAHGESRSMNVTLERGEWALLHNEKDSMKYYYGEVDNSQFRLMVNIFEMLVYGPDLEDDEN